MILKERTAYMVRNDGEVFKCTPFHPYILFHEDEIFRNNVLDLSECPWVLDWFLKYSKQNLKPLMINCLECLAGGILGLVEKAKVKHDKYPDTEAYIKFGIGEEDLKTILNNISLKIDPKPVSDVDDDYVATCKALWEELNYRTNQEFLRARMSDQYRYGSGNDIYFRISSFNFNWYNIICNILFDNPQITSVTISLDEQSGRKSSKIYILQGQPVDHMSVEDFIMMKGRPVVESQENKYIRNLEKGIPLNEALPDFGSFHNNNRYRTYREIYMKENFIEVKPSRKYVGR